MGVKATHSEFWAAFDANDQQHSDTHQVERHRGQNTNRIEQQRLGKTQFLAEDPQIQRHKQRHQRDAFDTGTLWRHVDVERIHPDDLGTFKCLRFIAQSAQQPDHALKGEIRHGFQMP